MTTPAFIPIEQGSLVEYKQRLCRVTHILGIDTVLVKDVETNVSQQARPTDLKLEQAPDSTPNVRTTPDLEAISDEDLAEAERRFAIIRPLIGDRHRSRSDTEQVARNAGVHIATVYQWLRAFNDSGLVTSLIPQKRGRKRGSKKVDEQIEAIVQASIEKLYLSIQRHKPQDIIEDVIIKCRTAGLTPPHPNTIRNRIREIPQRMVLKRRGHKDQARNQFNPIRGNFPGANSPLAVVEIDHTKADIIVVDTESRKAMGRPWITIAIDVFSRMIVGCYVTMDPPSAVSVGMCVARAILRKDDYLSSLNVPGDWPVWGRMKKVHTDNAREFRGSMLSLACKQYAIDLDLRPVKVPHYGGHIERWMGTSANEIRKLPGTTFSNPTQRKGYDSKKESALTLLEFERVLVDFIVNVYHQRIHTELNVPPRRQWEIGILGDAAHTGTGILEPPADPERVYIDFLPAHQRTVQPYGIVMDEVFYYHEVLSRWINATDNATGRKQQFTIRRDPRDISKVYFYDPEVQQHYSIPYRNPQHPPISLWELRETQRELKKEGKALVDESAIFGYVARRQELISQARLQTDAARRQQHRAKTARRLAESSNTGAEHARAVQSAENQLPVARAIANDDLFMVRHKPFPTRMNG